MLYYGIETGSSALFLTERVWKVSKTCGAEYQCGFSKMRRGKREAEKKKQCNKEQERASSDRQVKRALNEGGGTAKRARL